MKTTNTIYEIRVEMWRKGGEFVRQLAQALKAADLDNQRRIVEAFPEIIEKYDGFATLTKQQNTQLIN